MAEGYAINTASRLNEIGFAEFTSDLITKTFDALIDAELRQTESYIELVKEMTKSLTVYINETVNEIPPTEIAGYLGSLPPFTTSTGQPVVNTVDGTPASLSDGETVNAGDLNTINQSMTSGDLVNSIVNAANATGVTGLIKDALGKVGELMGGKTDEEKAKVYPIPGNTTYYSPTEFATLFPEGSSSTANIDKVAVAKLYDSVAEVIASNKYALLQEMVKLGIMRLVVEKGVIRTALTFTTWENQSETASQSEKYESKVRDVYVQKTPRRPGIIGMIRARPIERHRTKTRDLHVSTSDSSSSSNQGTNIVITGGVEIYFRTDYLPVAQA